MPNAELIDTPVTSQDVKGGVVNGHYRRSHAGELSVKVVVYHRSCLLLSYTSRERPTMPASYGVISLHLSSPSLLPYNTAEDVEERARRP